jgi:sensor histidine kinase YesM
MPLTGFWYNKLQVLYNLGLPHPETRLPLSRKEVMGMSKNRINEKNSKIIRFLTESRYRTLRHIILLVAFVMLHQSARTLFNLEQDCNFRGIYGILDEFLPFFIFTGILYINIYLLMPLFFNGKYLQYFWLVVILIMMGLLVMHYVSDTFLDPHRIIPKADKLNNAAEFLSATIFIIPIVLATSAARLMQKWIKDRDRINELNTITVNMELTALKNQINPHFLFNMLNNVNMLVQTSPGKASSVIIKLSEFLRYQLYENESGTASVMDECNFLSNFLNLEKLRRDNFNFTISCETARMARIHIPPNLFTTFVENAIKHSVDLSGNEAFVGISITVNEGYVVFSCTNSQNPEDNFSHHENGGLGLANIKRRLELLYGSTYSLEISNERTSYNVTLSIPYDVYNN